jgi:uncharacterized protein (TIGR03084 family)
MIIDDLCADLLAERAELFNLLSAVGDRWRAPTPAVGWSIRDQVTHLAWFDEAATLAIAQPQEFTARLVAARKDTNSIVEATRLETYSRPDEEVAAWLAAAGDALISAARSADPKMRVPWYGPAMSLASCLTARIMETWAHGQDLFDALGVERQPSARLHHIAFIGWRAVANSFVAQGLPVPTDPVRVELTDAAVGEVVLGAADAVNVVRGSLVDFCLLVTQRRHLDDTDLIATGPVASKWLTIAQAFAGPPGAGRSAGQFR